MIKKSSNKLVWGSLVLLSIIIIAILIILNNNGKKENFDTIILSEAQKILNTIKDKKAENPDFDERSINEKNIEQLIGISAEDFEQLKIIVDNEDVKIFLIGKNRLAGLMVCGTIDNLEIGNQCKDTTAPVITLIGDEEIRIEVFGTYNELGATVSDNYDEDLEVVINDEDLDLEKLGTYQIYYNVTDSSGNAAIQVIRTVIVEDTTAPVITLIGDTVIYLIVEETYAEPGATAEDNYDGVIDPEEIEITGEINLLEPGTYYIYYNVTDSSGNPAETVIRTIIVQEE